MKNNIKRIIIAIVAIFIVSLLIIVTIKNSKSNKYIRPAYDYTAEIYHSVMLGMDAGVEYHYYIYPISQSNNKEYFYIKSKSDITINGSSVEKDIDSGSIKNKTDLLKLEEDILNDNNKTSISNVTYTFKNKGMNENCNSLKELANKIFE